MVSSSASLVRAEEDAGSRSGKGRKEDKEEVSLSSTGRRGARIEGSLTECERECLVRV